MGWKDALNTARKIPEIFEKGKRIVANVKAGIEVIEFAIEKFSEANSEAETQPVEPTKEGEEQV
jgi:hypothetical protein